MLGALAAQTSGLAPPTGSGKTEQAWLAALAAEDCPRYECERTEKGLTLTVQTEPDGPRRVLGEGLTLAGAALVECGHRGWPEEAVAVIRGFTAAELARDSALTRGREITR